MKNIYFIKIPNPEQDEGNCAPTACEWAVPVDYDELKDELNWQEEHGCCTSDIQDLLERYGYHTIVFDEKVQEMDYGCFRPNTQGVIAYTPEGEQNHVSFYMVVGGFVFLFDSRYKHYDEIKGAKVAMLWEKHRS